MKVKICGITNLNDALLAVKYGADALGFLFYTKSPRYISPEKAFKIINELPPFIEKVGLFVNETAENINKISKIAGITLAQIHFKADDNLYKNLDIKHIKVIRVKTKNDILIYKDEYKILDAFVEEYGGSGKKLPLEWFKNIDCNKIILAGGLTPDNLDTISGLNLYGVDVSSGVEKSKGLKDKSKVINFIKKAKSLGNNI